MMGRLIAVVLLLAIVGGALFVASDAEHLADLRASVGLGLPEGERLEVRRMDPPEVEAEMARLAALPVPGVEMETPDEAPPTLGAMAEAAQACVAKSASVLRQPKMRAKTGLARYLLVFGAIGADPESPLLEPRFRPLTPLLAEGPEAVQAKLAEGKVAPDDVLLMAEFHRVYRDVDHPLYHGLQLYKQTFEALDFEALADTVAARPGPTLDCVIADTLPERPAAEGEAAAEAGN